MAKKRQGGDAQDDPYRKCILMEGPGALFEDGEEAKEIVELLKLTGPEDKVLRQVISLLKVREAARRFDDMPGTSLLVIEREAEAILREQGMDDLHLRNAVWPKEGLPGANRFTPIAHRIQVSTRRMRGAFEVIAGRGEAGEDVSPEYRDNLGSKVMSAKLHGAVENPGPY